MNNEGSFKKGGLAILQKLPEGGLARQGLTELIGKELPIVNVFPVNCTCGLMNGEHAPKCAIAENQGSNSQVVLKISEFAQVLMSGSALKKP